MLPVGPGPVTVTREVVTTVTAPATLYGCRWAVFRGTELPEAMTGPDGRGKWYPLRLTADGRLVASAGLPQDTEAAAVKWAESDMWRLAEAEEDWFRRHGTAPEPLRAAHDGVTFASGDEESRRRWDELAAWRAPAAEAARKGSE